MKQLSLGHRCDFCRQEIGYVLPEAPAEAFGADSRSVAGGRRVLVLLGLMRARSSRLTDQ